MLKLNRIGIRCLFVLIISSISSSIAARTAPWKPERALGSAQLALKDIHHIYLPPEPSDALSEAVEDLAGLWPGQIEQRVVPPAASKRSIILLRDESIEGFSLHRDRTKVYLSASTDEGLANGLYAICREFLGARWYWPGDLGFERVGEAADHLFHPRPKGTRVIHPSPAGAGSGQNASHFTICALPRFVPDRIWREQPAFVQRSLNPVGTDFARRNGLSRFYSFNHNLARIYSPELYEASPEAFAEIGGARRPPARSAKYDPQPDFTELKAVEIAAEAARSHFKENPDANSFSLSINDNSLYDEGPVTEAVVRGDASGGEGLKVESCEGEVDYFRGRPNYTDLVFGFMNEVAERLYEGEKVKGEKVLDLCRLPTFDLRTFAHSHPSQPYLTALAYYWTEQSPSFKLHPRVMPVLTSDRAQWHDPAYRAEDKALIQRWANSGAERIATWDYYYGEPYPYPRQFTQWIGESIRYLHESGVDVFYSKMPSIWGLDGPKAWLTAELLRDPEQDVEVLLAEFYTNFFGEAAEPIRKFYEIAERTRNEREGPANWIKFYKDEAGIELFDEATLERMREFLDQAQMLVAKACSCSVAACGGHVGKGRLQASTTLLKGRFAERVKVVSDAFSYTESYADYHRMRSKLVELSLAALQSDRANGEELAHALEDYQSTKASFRELSRSLAEEPMHHGFKTFDRLLQSEPSAMVLAALSLSDHDLEDLGLEEATTFMPILRAWRVEEVRPIQFGKNPHLKHSGTELRNFLGPEMPVLDAWYIQYRASKGLRVTAADGASASGLRVENADIVSLSQTYPVFSERSYLLQIEASWQVSPDNRTWVQLNWDSIGGEDLRTDILLRLPNGTSEGNRQLQFAFKAPGKAYDLKVGIVTNRQYDGDYLELKRVELSELVTKR